jgi:hypothetical protein
VPAASERRCASRVIAVSVTAHQRLTVALRSPRRPLGSTPLSKASTSPATQSHIQDRPSSHREDSPISIPQPNSSLIAHRRLPPRLLIGQATELGQNNIDRVEPRPPSSVSGIPQTTEDHPPSGVGRHPASADAGRYDRAIEATILAHGNPGGERRVVMHPRSAGASCVVGWARRSFCAAARTPGEHPP